MGGYAAAPGGIAAWMTRIPLVVHEQNRVPGFTNRLLVRFARRSLAGFSAGIDGSEWTGNPVREEIAAVPTPQTRLAGREGPVRILVLGGEAGQHGLTGGRHQGAPWKVKGVRPGTSARGRRRHGTSLVVVR